MTSSSPTPKKMAAGQSKKGSFSIVSLLCPLAVIVLIRSDLSASPRTPWIISRMLSTLPMILSTASLEHLL
jgi:hypothetical protein